MTDRELPEQVQHEPTSDTSAFIVPPGWTEIYDLDGHPTLVRDADVPRRLSLGYSLQPHDPTPHYDALAPLFETAKTAIERFWQDVQKSGSIDREGDSDLAVAHEAMGQLAETWSHFVGAMFLVYPRQESEPVKMRRPDGRVLNVDPSQVEAHIEGGLVHVDGE